VKGVNVAIFRKIFCERKTCENSYKEQFENQGFPNWGHISGLCAKDKNGNEITLTLCPDCLKEVLQWLHGQI
jgi:hypothetical protein